MPEWMHIATDIPVEYPWNKDTEWRIAIPLGYFIFVTAIGLLISK